MTLKKAQPQPSLRAKRGNLIVRLCKSEIATSPPFAGSGRLLAMTGRAWPCGAMLVLIVAGFALFLNAIPATGADFQDTNARMQEMAGDAIFFGDEVLAKAKELKPGEKFTIDEDKDGDPDILIFNDNDPKHTIQPILVKVIDEDDDMKSNAEADTDSDCWIADWQGDGVIDCVVDYEDKDGDNDVDLMVLYDKDFYGRTIAIVCEDHGDDNRLWYTRNYTYDQPGCQWLTDFNGDELFCMYDFDVQTGELFPKFENPFSFYDMDGDQCSEIVIRFSGLDREINHLRYSFDVDNDAKEGNPHDYDFSFNCEGAAPIPPDAFAMPTFRNGKARNGHIAWEKGIETANAMTWQKNMFIWDEGDNTANPDDEVQKFHDRWEGVGGYRLPKCNFRREYDADFSGKYKLYWWPIDQRLHQFGAETGELYVDYNFDGKEDMVFFYKDTNEDGYFDVWQIDIGADGSIERESKDERLQVIDVSIEEYQNLHSFYVNQLKEALKANREVIEAMKKVMGRREPTPIEEWFTRTMPKEYHAAKKLASSPEAKRYYQDITREFLFAALRNFLADRGTPLSREQISIYQCGKYDEFARMLTANYMHTK